MIMLHERVHAIALHTQTNAHVSILWLFFKIKIHLQIIVGYDLGKVSIPSSRVSGDPHMM